MNDAESRETIAAFRNAVNMAPAELDEWLGTPASKEVGWVHDGESESVGHQSGRRIVKLLRTKQAEYTDADLRHMGKVAGYVHRHLAQRPNGDIENSRWRHSLMNWGHDPVKR